MWRKITLVVAAVAALAVSGFGGAVAQARIVNGPAVGGEGLAFSGCVIRLYASGPAIHSNSAHSCVGVQSVQNVGGNLVITHSQGGPIVACTAAIDESLALRGVIAGCSGGNGTSTIEFYDTDTGKHVGITSAGVASDNTNVWMSWVADAG